MCRYRGGGLNETTNLLDRRTQTSIENPVWLDRVVDVLSDGPGIWYPLVKRGTYVQEGMKIGFVTDYFGKLILEARAPVSGVILHINAVPSLKKGDNIADIAAIAAHAP